MVYVYALQSLEFDQFYVGMTKDVEIRLKEHNAGKSKYTKSYRPWKLVYKEECVVRATPRLSKAA